MPYRIPTITDAELDARFRRLTAESATRQRLLSNPTTIGMAEDERVTAADSELLAGCYPLQLAVVSSNDAEARTLCHRACHSTLQGMASNMTQRRWYTDLGLSTTPAAVGVLHTTKVPVCLTTPENDADLWEGDGIVFCVPAMPHEQEEAVGDLAALFRAYADKRRSPLGKSLLWFVVGTRWETVDADGHRYSQAHEKPTMAELEDFEDRVVMPALATAAVRNLSIPAADDLPRQEDVAVVTRSQLVSLRFGSNVNSAFEDLFAQVQLALVKRLTLERQNINNRYGNINNRYGDSGLGIGRPAEGGGLDDDQQQQRHRRPPVHAKGTTTYCGIFVICALLVAPPLYLLSYFLLR